MQVSCQSRIWDFYPVSSHDTQRSQDSHESVYHFGAFRLRLRTPVCMKIRWAQIESKTSRDIDISKTEFDIPFKHRADNFSLPINWVLQNLWHKMHQSYTICWTQRENTIFPLKTCNKSQPVTHTKRQKAFVEKPPTNATQGLW